MSVIELKERVLVAFYEQCETGATPRMIKDRVKEQGKRKLVDIKRVEWCKGNQINICTLLDTKKETSLT